MLDASAPGEECSRYSVCRGACPIALESLPRLPALAIEAAMGTEVTRSLEVPRFDGQSTAPLNGSGVVRGILASNMSACPAPVEM